MVSELASSFSQACSCNWNGRPSQMTLLISEYYLPATTAFFCLHNFWRAENNDREPSVYRVGPSIYKSHLRTSEFIKTESHLWKLANCNEPQFLILSFQKLLPVQVLHSLQDDSLYQKCAWSGFGEYTLIINADVLKTINFLKIQKGNFKWGIQWTSLAQKIGQGKFLFLLSSQRASVTSEAHETTKVSSQACMNRHGFFYSCKLSLPNASYFWSGNYTGQFCMQANKWHWGNTYLNIVQHWQWYLWSAQDTSRVNGHLQASVQADKSGEMEGKGQLWWKKQRSNDRKTFFKNNLKKWKAGI